MASPISRVARRKRSSRPRSSTLCSCSADAPIRTSLKELSTFLASQSADKNQEAMERRLEAALRQNETVFRREEVDGNVYYVTSKKGHYVAPTRAHAYR